MGLDVMVLVFWMLSFKSTFSLSSFTFIKRLFSSSLSAIKVVSSEYLRLLIFLLAVLIPVCASSSLAFCKIYSAYKLNKQGDNIQPWCTPFPICNQSVVPCPILIVAYWPKHRFLRRQVRWSGIPISLRVFHSLLWFTQSKSIKQKKDIFLEFSCSFYDLDVGILISGFSAFSKSSLYIWKFSVYILTYCWSLAWRILSITLLDVKWVQLRSSLNILWHHPSLELEWKLTFSSPVSTADFSKFAGILSAALSQHTHVVLILNVF